MTTHDMGQELEDCIDRCMACHVTCLETIEHCLGLGEPYTDRAHIRLLRDAAEIALSAADFMLRSSVHHTAVCSVCADICESAADSCEDLAAGDELMQRCADSARACADSCREISLEDIDMDPE